MREVPQRLASPSEETPRGNPVTGAVGEVAYEATGVVEDGGG